MNAETPVDPAKGCPISQDRFRSLLGRTNKDWWPDALPVEILHQGGVSPDPMGEDFDYAAAFRSLDYQAVKDDLTALSSEEHTSELQSLMRISYAFFCLKK